MRTTLGYHSLTRDNLQKLYGYRTSLTHPPAERVHKVLDTLKESGIDTDPEKIDNPEWEKFPHEEFSVYDHKRPTIRRFIDEVAKEKIGWVHKVLTDYFMDTTRITTFIPAELIKRSAGWVCYPHTDYSKPVLGLPPQELVYTLDTETFVQHTVSKYGLNRFAPPIIATATSDRAHYIWLHPALTRELASGEKMKVELVPLEERRSLVLYWNSAYDVPRVLNSYDYNSQVMAIDLMSMHITRHGFSTDQRDILKSLLKKGEKHLPLWARVGSGNSLIAAYNYHCASTLKDCYRLDKEDKEIRDFFVKMTSLSELDDESVFQEMVSYANKDSTYTYELSKRVLPDYLRAQGSLLSLACHSDLALSKFNVDEVQWEDFFQHSEEMYHTLLEENGRTFDLIAKQLFESYDSGYITEEDIASDPYYSNWDWKDKGRLRKVVRKYYTAYDRLGNPLDGEHLLPEKTKVSEYLTQLQTLSPKIHKIKLSRKEEEFLETPGYGIPRWVWPLFDPAKRTLGLTNKSVIAHQLLRMKYRGHPILHDQENKFHIVNESGAIIKLPHKDGVGLNVGSFLAKDYIRLFEDGEITSDTQQEKLARVFEIAKLTAYWTSARSRVAEYYVHPSGDGVTGTVMCNFTPCQTLSQRGASKLISTIPDPQVDKIGSDVKTLMRPRQGRTLVGVDFS